MNTVRFPARCASACAGSMAVLFLLTAMLLAPRLAWAHALLERSDPVAETILPSSPTQIHLWFSEDLNGGASNIVVWDRHRRNETVGQAHLVLGHPRELEIAVKPLLPGAYLVLWTSVSAADGHILHGSYLFYVKVRGPGPSLAGVDQGGTGQGFPDTTTLISLVAHWLELLMAVVWVGSEAFALLVLPAAVGKFDAAAQQRAEHRRRRLVRASLLMLLVASGILLLAQVHALGGNWSAVGTVSAWSAVFDDQYGHLWIGRQILVLLALVSTASVDRVPTMSPALAARPAGHDPKSDSWPAVLLGAIYLFLLAASGHGASAAIGTLGAGQVVSVSVLVDWLHVLADALWFGGQVYLALALLPAIRLLGSTVSLNGLLSVLKRFSPVAYVSVGLFTVSGAFNARIHIPSWYAFFNSVYGKTLIIKIVLIGMMMLVSVLTVYGLRPRLKHALQTDSGEWNDRISAMSEGLLFFLRLNPALGIGVLLTSSVLFYYPVPYKFLPPGPSSYAVTQDGLTARISLSPDRSGLNVLVVRLTDRQHRPVTQAHITVLTTMLDMVMGTGIAPLRETSAGTFQGTVELSMGGHWRLEMHISSPALSAGYSRPTVTVIVGT